MESIDKVQETIKATQKRAEVEIAQKRIKTMVAAKEELQAIIFPLLRFSNNESLSSKYDNLFTAMDGVIAYDAKHLS